jgi:threonine synthase
MNERARLRCSDCRAALEFHPLRMRCPQCQSEWLEFSYPPPDGLPQGPGGSLWRYSAWLPVQPIEGLILGAGGTPLTAARALGLSLGLDHLWIKDERQGPTSTFKDRQASLTVHGLSAFGLREAVVASTGNVAMAFAAYCARAGIRLWTFLTSLVPLEKMHEIGLYGAHAVKVTGSYDAVKPLAAAFARQRGAFMERGVRNPLAVEALKTIAYEIAEALGHAYPRRADGRPWRAPDWYVQAVSGGLGPIAVGKGFAELARWGIIDGIPKMAIIQAEGCAPMAAAWGAGSEEATPVNEPRTRIASLTTGAPGRAYRILRRHLLEHGGTMQSVSDAQAAQAMRQVAALEGISMEPAAAVAFAGLKSLVAQGAIQRHEIVVVNCSGHGMPASPEVLPAGWAESLEATCATPSPEGLLGALRALNRPHRQRLLIVDDHAEARRLLRRLVTACGDFQILEAASGQQALELAQTQRPDGILLDLMMPEMDGFGVLERLQAHPRTRSIPVIVVTAKALTPTEKAFLQKGVVDMMEKGDLRPEQLERALRALHGEGQG